MLISEDQIQELYEINDDPKRKEFLDDLFSFMQKRGTPINRLPIMAKSVLDLYELYNLVIARGGLVDVINKKLWQEIIKGLHLPSSITSAAFTLRTQYMKYLYPYECEKKNLSTPAELQAAIDGNRREGRRSSYGQYEAMHNQMQMPQMARQSLPGGMQQMSPLALVTHAAAANNQQAQAAAAAAAAHHRLMGPSFGQVPNLVTQEIEQRMIEYLKLIQVKKEQNAMSNGSAAAMGLSPHHQHQQQQHQQQQQQQHQQQQQQQQQRQRSQSPEISTREALNALEMSRVALWQMYHNNTSPPASVNTSPQGGGSANSGGNAAVEAQRSEALNLSDSPPNLTTIKREREREPSPEICERDDFPNQPPPAKRAGFPASFYLPPGMSGMAAAAAAANFHYRSSHHDSDGEADGENDDDGEHNTTVNSSHDERQQLNGGSVRPPRHHGSNSSVHNDKSDDSAIENSPSTSAASAGNGNISPVSTKKTHLSKQTQQHTTSSNRNDGIVESNNMAAGNPSLGPFDALSLLSGMQFRVTRNALSCEYKCGPSLTGGICYCHPGQSLAPDNRTCVDLDECAEWGNCDQLCTNTEGSYTCSCSHGYTLINNAKCIAPDANNLQLIFAHDRAVVKMSAHGGDPRVIANASAASGVAYHYQRNTLYWSDIKTRKVQSLPLDVFSSAIQPLDLTLPGTWAPVALAVDWVGDKIYVADLVGQKIDVFELSGNWHAVVLGSNLTSPADLALDPTAGLMFVADGGQVLRAHMDGTHTRSIVSEAAYKASGVTVDIIGEQQLQVNLELNGIKYSGVLIAHTTNLTASTSTLPLAATTTSTTATSLMDESSINSSSNNTENNINNNCSRKTGNSPHDINNTETRKDLVVAMDAMEETNELTVRETETPPNTTLTTTTTMVTMKQTTNAVMANGPNTPSTLKDALITS